MLITTMLAFLAARRIWRWPLAAALAVTALFIVPDLAFFGAAIVKIPAGGWFPLVVAAAVLAVMTAWQQGRSALAENLGQRLLPVDTLLQDIERRSIRRVPGTAVYLTGDATGTPIALLHNLKLHQIVHERNVFLTVQIEEIPHVPVDRRLEIVDLGAGFHRLVARFGFMEDADVPAVLEQARAAGLALEPMETTYVLSRNQLIPARRSKLSHWRRQLFIYLSRNALSADHFFQLPPNRVVEIGMQVEL
jgi:KUP system potassium uptake protein